MSKTAIDIDNPAHPNYYRGDLRKADGTAATWSGGHYFNLGQLDELHCPPKATRHDGEDYRLAIGTMALNNGAFFAHGAAREHREEKGKPLPKSGGTFTYSRQFPTRDAALRANAAYVLRCIRSRFRAPAPAYGLSSWRISEERYRELVAWVYEVIGKPAPSIYVAPPRPAPRAVPAARTVERNGQIRLL